MRKVILASGGATHARRTSGDSLLSTNHRVPKNMTGRNRWGRYRVIDGERHKLCNGPLHPEGAWVPISGYWMHKRGDLLGKPYCRCIECERVSKGRDREGRYVPVSRYWWVFVELRNRLGKVETLRRLGLSNNFWWRIETGYHKNVKRDTVRKAIVVLSEVRAKNEVRHRDSIQHGAYLRGHEEKVPIRMRDLYVSKSSGA